MLRTIHTMEELDISGWMEVYREGHEENGAYFYPDEPPERALHLAEEDSRRFLEGFFQIPGAQYWIWEEEGRYVSCLRLKPDRDGLLLEALETRPDCRRRGFGKQLILSVLSHLPRGTRIYSEISKENLPSLAIHRVCGFSQVLDYGLQEDGSKADHCVTMGVTI